MSLARTGEFSGLESDAESRGPAWVGDEVFKAADHHSFAMERVRERKLTAVEAKLSKLSLRQLQQILEMSEDDNA